MGPSQSCFFEHDTADAKIFKACRRDSIKELEIVLREEPMSVYSTNENNSSPLTIAASTRSVKLVETLLRYQADPNHKNRFGVTPLMFGTKMPTVFQRIKSMIIPTFVCCTPSYDEEAVLR